MTREQPTSREILDALGSRMADALSVPARGLDLVPMGSVIPRADGAAAFRVVDPDGRCVAVFQCSAPDFPEMVARSMRCAAEAKRALAATEAAAILDPVLETRLDGMSCALLRYCQPLSNQRLVWRLQRELLRPRLLAWLLRVTQQTVAEATPDERSAHFAAPLERIAGERALHQSLRDDARRALQRLGDGSWRPRHVLMHGDVWKGNVLVEPTSTSPERRAWRDRFVVIDWPGSLRRGYAVYDLVRLAGSMRLGPAGLRSELRRHCDALDAQPDDAGAYLLCALGHVALHLEHFPIDQFVAMAHSCHDTLRQTSIH